MEHKEICYRLPSIEFNNKYICMGNVCSQQEKISAMKKIITARTSQNDSKLKSPKQNTTFETTSIRQSKNSTQSQCKVNLIPPPNLIPGFDLDIELQRLEQQLFDSTDSETDVPKLDLRKMQKSHSFLFQGNTIRQQ